MQLINAQHKLSLMKRHAILTLLLILFTIKGMAQCKEVVGYYPNWQWYDRNKLAKPANIDYSKYSILNYAFFKPELDGSISGTDAWADENLLLGEFNWATNQYIPNTSIVDLAHNNGVKILPSIGGWTLSDNFPIIAADPAKRQAFAQACVNLIQQYNFDGIDLDWEYPGYAPHGGSAADKANFTLLLQEVRSAIDAYGVTVNKPMLLTAAVGAAADRMDDVDWPVVAQLLDIINLMSYDFFGAWDPTTNHNSPLYPPAQGDPSFNLDSTVTRLVNYYNVNPQKITVGVAFYGRTSKTSGPAGLHSPTTGQVDNSTFFVDDGSPLYYNVMDKMNLFTQNWDSQAQVPYLTGNGNLQTFVSYDDEQSIGLKAQYIVDKNLRGAIIWEITGDMMESTTVPGTVGSTPLADTLNNVFCNYTGGGGNAPVVTITGNISICEGDSTALTATGANNYSWNSGQSGSTIWVNPTSTTSYTVTGSNANGSDTETITVTVNSSYSNTLNTVTICQGESANIFGNTQNTAGTYYNYLQTIHGCDSTLSQELIVLPTFTSTMNPVTICEGESATIFGSQETIAGTYSNTYQASNSCDSVVYQELIVNTVDTSVTTSQNSITAVASNATYQWIDCNTNQPISGATNQTYSPQTTGSYAVEVTQNGCTETSSCYSFVIDNIATFGNYATLNAYPNPTNSIVTIDLGKSCGNVDVMVTDATGKTVVATSKSTGQYLNIDLQPYANGLYIIQVRSESQTWIGRIQKIAGN